MTKYVDMSASVDAFASINIGPRQNKVLVAGAYFISHKDAKLTVEELATLLEVEKAEAQTYVNMLIAADLIKLEDGLYSAK